MKGYNSYNLYRKLRHRRARRNSGGVAVYFKHELKHGIEIVKNVYDTIIWIKLDKTFFELHEDVFICGSYIWGEDSPAYYVHNVDLFELLEDDINYYSNHGKVLICGDFNCRVVLKPDYIVCDRNTSNIDDTDYTPDIHLPRVSEDKTSNGQGTKLLDLCKATKLRIANGRLGEDIHSGSFTYTNVGSSVVDYLLIRECDFDIVSNFKVSSFNIYSDHTPLNFGIVCGNILRRQNIPNTEYEQYRWNEQKRDMFRLGLISKLPDLNTLTLTNDNLSSENICSTVKDFVEILDSVAKPLFCKSGKYKDKASFKSCKYMSKAWFDDDCKRAKDSYVEALRNFNTNRCDVH